MATSDGVRVLLHGDHQCAVVDLEGELTGASAPFVQNVVEQLLAHPGGAARIEVHLAELERCDRDGVDLLVRLDEAASRAGRELVLIEPSSTVQRVLDGRTRSLPVDSR